MRLIEILFSNALVNVCVLSWTLAQVLKVLFHWMSTGNIHWDRLTGSGGMPSSHSALVTSLAIGVVHVEGFSSTLFAMCMAFAGVVMYDAMGVRRAAGEHARALNEMLTDYQNFWDMLKNHPLLDFDDDSDINSDEVSEEARDSRRALKEYLGHTPMEVLAGCLLGILVAMIYPL